MTILASGLTATAYLGGALGYAVASSQVVRQNLDTLTRQAADGKISDTYAGLGGGMAVALAVPPAIAHLAAWQSNIDAASGAMQVRQTALAQISSIASGFYSNISTISTLDASSIDTVAASARDALRQVAGLLDSTDAGNYVFAGQDNANPPIPDPDDINSSAFATQIASAVGGLAANGAAPTIAATLAIATSNTAGTTPFSAALSQPAAVVNALRPSIQTGADSSTTTGMVASANSDVASTGGSTTGSYTRDILRSLATLGSLSSTQVSAGGFQQLVADVRAALGSAVTGLNADAGVLGNRQSALTTARASLVQAGTALQSQVSNAQDVDMAATLTNLTRTQTQLQASYQIIAGLQGQSLTKFIS